VAEFGILGIILAILKKAYQYKTKTNSIFLWAKSSNFQKQNYLKFEVHTAMNMEVTVFDLWFSQW
jgi:hypothetical protein